MGKIKKSSANAAAVIAVAFSFCMYVAAFEPFGAAELAYVFAVPAILACRFLCGKNGAAQRRAALERAGLADKTDPRDSEAQKKRGKKIWLVSAFAFSYAAWIAILVWLRHVYPPAGYAAAVLLPLIIAGLFVFPWFALLPKMLPSLGENHAARLVKLAGAASLWVALEWARSWMFSGFPWNLLAHSQWLRPASIQSAEYGGVWIVSFTLIFFNLAIAEYVYRLFEWQRWKMSSNFAGKIPYSRFSPEFYAALALAMSGVWIYISKMPRPENRETAFCAGMVQTDFAGILKWDEKLAESNLAIIERLTDGLKLAQADVALWPEAATPPRWPVVGTPAMQKWIERLSAKNAMPIIMGNMAYDFAEKTAQGGAFAVSPKDGLYEKFYAKRRLVPFGEYVPSWCKWLGKVVPTGDMKAGSEPVLLEAEIRGKKYKVGALICYEDIFPKLGRETAKAGADMLFVCTNDSWYGREGGAWQHAAHSAFQAVSTRLPLMRSSNNGLSAVFDQYGNMRPSFTLKNADGSTWNADTPSPAPALKITDPYGNALEPESLKIRRSSPLLDSDGSIYFRGAGFADVVFYKNFRAGDTFYVRHGDWFVGLCFVNLAYLAIRSIIRKISKLMRRANAQ